MIKREEYAFPRLNIAKADVVLLAAASAFCLFSFFYSLKLQNTLYTLSCLGALALVFAPRAVEAIFRVRISTDLKVAFTFLIVSGPVLGNVYKLYHIVPGWDKIMHATSGYAFAALGFSLPGLIDRRTERHSRLMRASFAFCFSMAIAAVWEIYEYLLDVFFQMDMQNDTIIHGISSYLLGAEEGVIGEIGEISSVVINGHALPYNGYIDIGLIDTMNDMLICMAGTALLIVIACTRKGNSDFSTITVKR